MECFDIPEGLLRCIAVVKPWYELVIALGGAGSITIITLLSLFIKKLRAELAQTKKDYERLRLDKQETDELVRSTNRDLGASRFQLTLYEKALQEGGNEDEELAAALHAIDGLETRFSTILKASSRGDAAFWSRPPRVDQRMTDYEARIRASVPILMFATQKGGVGKTTLTANIAAGFADQGKRVLVVDLDYQGSVSEQLILQGDLKLDDAQSRIDQLLLDALDDRWPREVLRAHSRLDFIPAFYDLERLERHLEYRWAIEDTTDDARYRLARAMLSDYVQQRYDIVLIDAPPRMTMGFINGFCTSTHLFVPTVIDFVSVPAVGRFARAFRDLVPNANPRIKFAGIIGTLANRGPQLAAVNEEAADAAERRAQAELRDNHPLFMRNAVMKRDVDVANAAISGIAYWQKPTVQPMFRTICAEVERRL